MDVRIVRSEDGTPLGAVKTVGTEEQWAAIERSFQMDREESDVPLFEDPEEFLIAAGQTECTRCGRWQADPCICYAR